MRATRSSAGGDTPQTTKHLNRLNDRSRMCQRCELCIGDRNYLPKTEPVILTSSVFVMEEGGNN
jgi:hypothetical protein